MKRKKRLSWLGVIQLAKAANKYFLPDYQYKVWQLEYLRDLVNDRGLREITLQGHKTKLDDDTTIKIKDDWLE